MLADEWERSAAQVERLKLALVSAGADAEDLFAEMWESEEVDPVEDAERDYDYSAVQWDQDASADDWQRMQDALAATRVSVPGESEGGGGLPPLPEVPDVDFDADFDREWT